MEIFIANPKSFKMDSKSLLATDLKASVAKKLIQFTADLNDHMLAEYVVVLVCNGKCQYQARDELEAFLGERSGEFVSWLWDVLLKNALDSNTTISSSDLEHITDESSSDGDDVDKKQKISRSRGFQKFSGSDDNQPTKDKKHNCRSTHNRNLVSSDDEEVSEGFQDWCPGFFNSLNEAYIEEAWSQTSRSESPIKFGASKNNYFESLKYDYFRVRASAENLAGGEQSMQYEKIIDGKCDGLPHQPYHSSNREPLSRNTRSYTTENPYVANVAGMRLFSRAAGAIFHQNARLRGNVWDRLGKSCEDDTIMMVEKNDGNPVDINERKTFKHSGQMFDQHGLMLSVRDGKLSRKSTGNFNVKSETNNVGRKRQFKALESTENLVSYGAPPAAKSEYMNNRESVTADFKPVQAQLSDVNLRLPQIETEVSKLQSKHIEMKKDGNFYLSSSSGLLNHPQEETKSRTVFVTNVHFAATKEALKSYFAKCGVVAKVIKLTDIVTARQKGSAYVTFASEESVDKAVALSGSSFFSRTIRVRKAEIPAVTSISTCGSVVSGVAEECRIRHL